MSEETEALNDMGTDLEVEFMESLKKDSALANLDNDPKFPAKIPTTDEKRKPYLPEKEERPVVPQNAETVTDRPNVPRPEGESQGTIDEFRMSPEAALKELAEMLVGAASAVDHTVLSLTAILAKTKKLAEAKMKDLEEEASREFEWRMKHTDAKSFVLGVGQFKRNGVKNVWTYSSALEERMKKADAETAAIKELQKAEQAGGAARKEVVPPAKAFAVSV